MPQALRIIGGAFRGRKIYFDDAQGLRPTHDRIRETLFNWLQFDIQDSTCLDLFAGSGALGFEALSRGASFVTFLDNHAKTVNNLKLNAQRLGVTQSEFYIHKIPTEINPLNSKRYDIIFLDPPFGKDLLPVTCDWIDQNNLLISGGLVYVECEKEAFDQVPFPASWVLKKQKHTQTLCYALFQRGE